MKEDMIQYIAIPTKNKLVNILYILQYCEDTQNSLMNMGYIILDLCDITEDNS